jgi:DNA-binding transcriptional LysR family regulator
MIEKIDLEWIKSFVYFAESNSVEEAALKLGLTQPAITQHLSKLDRVLPNSLFERHGKRKVLSERGREFYRDLSKELRNMDDILRKSQFEGAKESDVSIRLGINNEIYFRICDKLDFNGQLEVYNLRSPLALKWLLTREVDIAVSRTVPDSTEIIAVKWFTDTFVLAYPKSWQKDIEREGVKAVLLKRKFILNIDGRAPVEEVLEAMDLRPQYLRYSHKLTDWLALIKLVQDGRGWAIVPSSFELPPKVKMQTISSKSIPKTQFYILYHKSVRQYPGFQNLLTSMITSAVPGQK